MLDATQPKGANYYWKSEFLPELSDGYLDVFRQNAAGIESPMSQVILFHLAGELNEHDEDDGAVGNRDAAYVTAPPEPGRRPTRVARATRTGFDPRGSGFAPSPRAATTSTSRRRTMTQRGSRAPTGAITSDCAV